MGIRSNLELISIADQCVKCGQCLSVCPTYNLYQNETESPRGRISLIQGLLEGQLDSADKTTMLHLDHCLYCGNCESACPSGVDYIDLLDSCKQLYPANDIARWQLDILIDKNLFRPGVVISGLLPSGLKNRVPGVFQQALRLSLPGSEAVEYKTTSSTSNRPKIGIFTGCIGRQVDSKAINITARLLEYCGFDPVIPRAQTCCGAIYQHEGHQDKAERLLDKSIRAFAGHALHQIIYFASACGSRLRQGNFDAPVSEATRFIASLDEIIRFRTSIESKIAIHKPCSMNNTGDDWKLMIDLVRSIAGDLLVELPGNNTCCGAAGLHLLKYPEPARQLLEPKLKALQETGPGIVLTANTGCMLHLYNGLKEQGLDIQVMHPAEWISGLILEKQS
jgi:glycolate oxidase iron-sulfur subunit